MTKFDKTRAKWLHAHVLRRMGMKETFLIIRNAWFTTNELVEDDIRLPFLTDDFLEK